MRVASIRRWPTFPAIPTAWLEGFRRCYPELGPRRDAAVGAFPPVDEPDDALPITVPSRRYHRQQPVIVTPEQRMPFPLREDMR
jgi:hypothetical protein